MRNVSDDLIGILACPICKSELKNNFKQEFICVKHKSHKFGFTNGFPNFIVE